MIRLSEKKIIFNFEINEFNDIQDNDLTIKRKKLLNQDYIIDFEHQDIKTIFDIIFECEWAYLYLLAYRFNSKIVTSKKFVPTTKDFNFYENPVKWFSNSFDDISKINKTKINSGVLNFNIETVNTFENMFNQCLKFSLFINEINNYYKYLSLDNNYFITKNFVIGKIFNENIILFESYLNSNNFEKAELTINYIINSILLELKEIELYKNNYFNIDYPEVEKGVENNFDIEINEILNKYNQKSIFEIDFYEFFNLLYYLKNEFFLMKKDLYIKTIKLYQFKEEIKLYNEMKLSNKNNLEQSSFFDENLTFNSNFSISLKRFITYCKNDEIPKAEDLIFKLYSKIKSEVKYLYEYKNNYFNIHLDLNKINELKLDFSEEFYYSFYEKYTDKNVFEINFDEFFNELYYLQNDFLNKQKEDLKKFHNNFPEIFLIKKSLLDLNEIITLNNFKTLYDFDVLKTKQDIIEKMGSIIKDICDKFTILFQLSELSVNDKKHTTTNYITFPLAQSSTDLNLFSDLNVLIGLVNKSIEVKYNLERYQKENNNFDAFYQTGNIYVYTKLVKCLDALRYFYIKF